METNKHLAANHAAATKSYVFRCNTMTGAPSILMGEYTDELAARNAARLLAAGNKGIQFVALSLVEGAKNITNEDFNF